MSKEINWKRTGTVPILESHEKDGVVWLTYPALSKIAGIRHGFSTRLGGVSKEHLYSMNLSFFQRRSGRKCEGEFSAHECGYWLCAGKSGIF